MNEISNPYLSIVIPLFNEEEVVPKLLPELGAVCDSLGQSYEIILVDDGSNDRTPLLLKEAAARDSRFKVLKFSRNFGHQAAFNAGIDFAQGEVVVTMDGDLQHPPSLIPEFIKHAQAGFDIVIGERTSNQQNSWLREIIGKTIYRALSAMSGLQFKNSYIPYAVQARQAGEAKYTFKRLTSLVLSGVTSFSAAPLRLAFWAGLLVLVASIFFAAYVIWDHYTRPNPLIAGWATLVVLVLFLGSIQLIVLGVIGEYLYKMFYEIKGRPLYIISETMNIERGQAERSLYGIHNF